MEDDDHQINFLIFTTIFFFTILPELTLSSGHIDSHYLACNISRSCGNGLIIKYPFYIKNQQQPYCGYPGFRLSCNNKGNPVLKLPGNNNDLVVHEIFYYNQSILLSHDSNNSCIDVHEIRNLSLPENQFKFAPNQSEIFLFPNCKNSSQKGFLQRYKVGGGGRGRANVCMSGGGSKQNDTFVAVFKDNPNLGNVSRECGEGVAVTVDYKYHGDDDDMITGEIIGRGFMLNWIAGNCSVCEQSGGKCGFNETTYQFKCFCTDRAHALKCSEHESITSGTFFSFLLILSFKLGKYGKEVVIL